MDLGEGSNFLSSDKNFLYDRNESELRPKSIRDFQDSLTSRKI